MTCDFCKKIWSSKEEYEKQITFPYGEDTAIILDDERGNKRTLYIPMYYYSATYLPIDYCPKCGRKLTEDATTSSAQDAKQWLFSDLDDTIDCF